MSTSEIANIITNAFKQGKKILICGNGGSFSMASHFAAELQGRFKKERRALPAIALNDGSIITAIANDYSFDKVFSRQIEALGEKDDILITLSTSGTSKNIIEAQRVAIERDMIVIPFPTNQELVSDTAKTQETHLSYIHEICEKVENNFV